MILAQMPQVPAAAQEIAEATQVPVGYLQKVLRMLARAGILDAQRGAGGGFSLAKLPSAISVLDVLAATDSSISRIEKCPLGIDGHTKLCSVHRLLDNEIAHAERVFGATSIADLVNDFRPLCDARQVIPLSSPEAQAQRPDKTD